MPSLFSPSLYIQTASRVPFLRGPSLRLPQRYEISHLTLSQRKEKKNNEVLQGSTIRPTNGLQQVEREMLTGELQVREGEIALLSEELDGVNKVFSFLSLLSFYLFLRPLNIYKHVRQLTSIYKRSHVSYPLQTQRCATTARSTRALLPNSKSCSPDTATILQLRIVTQTYYVRRSQISRHSFHARTQAQRRVILPT